MSDERQYNQIQGQLHSMDSDELSQLKADIEETLKGIEERRLRSSFNEVMQVLEKYDLDLSDLRDMLGESRSRKGRATGKLPPKYHHPGDPQKTWSGRGRQPTWFVEALENGTGKDDMLIHR